MHGVFSLVVCAWPKKTLDWEVFKELKWTHDLRPVTCPMDDVYVNDNIMVLRGKWFKRACLQFELKTQEPALFHIT